MKVIYNNEIDNITKEYPFSWKQKMLNALIMSFPGWGAYFIGYIIANLFQKNSVEGDFLISIGFIGFIFSAMPIYNRRDLPPLGKLIFAIVYYVMAAFFAVVFLLGGMGW